MTEKLLEMLKELAAKLGQTVETLWPHVLRYICVDALAGLLAAGAAIVALAWIRSVIVSAFGNTKDSRSSFDEDDFRTAKLISGILLGAIAAVIAGCAISSELPKLLEPTGYLVNSILLNRVRTQ